MVSLASAGMPPPSEIVQALVGSGDFEVIDRHAPWATLAVKYLLSQELHVTPGIGEEAGHPIGALASVLSLESITGLARTHSHVLSGSGMRPNPGGSDTRDLYRAIERVHIFARDRLTGVRSVFHDPQPWAQIIAEVHAVFGWGPALESLAVGVSGLRNKAVGRTGRDFLDDSVPFFERARYARFRSGDIACQRHKAAAVRGSPTLRDHNMRCSWKVRIGYVTGKVAGDRTRYARHHWIGRIDNRVAVTIVDTRLATKGQGITVGAKALNGALHPNYTTCGNVGFQRGNS